MLTELTAETGGKVFRADATEEEIEGDLRVLEGERRNQYRLVFHPQTLTRDGSFHSISVTVAKRPVRVAVRSGYYAPAR